jgi:hypothetical protein
MMSVAARPTAGGQSEGKRTVPIQGRAIRFHELEVEASSGCTQSDLARADHAIRFESEIPGRLHRSEPLQIAHGRDHLKRRTNWSEISCDLPIEVDEVRTATLGGISGRVMPCRR